ncbi:MAG TPA: hypothetical protein VLX28_24445 [Thermoanaerobaculia bacterium]|nr:hypothetical protein [Thermoanaerobaculia bacterium]
MSHRVTLLAVVLLSLSALAGAATLPASPVAPPAPAIVCACRLPGAARRLS